MSSNPLPVAAQKIRAVLFDLDGTLVDTAPDLVASLNQLRGEEGLDPANYDTIRDVVSHGAKAMIETGFGIDAGHPQFENRRQRLLQIYSGRVAAESAVFPELEPVLEALEARAIPWGIVTNKPAWLTDPLVHALGLRPRAACVISGDTAARAKPHPDPLLLAASQLGIACEQCLYVGDAERDITAGRAAGMQTAVALFGYIGPQDRPDTWGADRCAQSAGDILQWI